MTQEHWVIYRYEADPQGIRILGIKHTSKSAHEFAANAAQIEADRANAARAERFAAGQAVGRLLTADDFYNDYRVYGVREEL